MIIEKITIDGKKYHIVATMSRHECDSCGLRNYDRSKCSKLCDSLAEVKGIFSVKFEEMNTNHV